MTTKRTSHSVYNLNYHIVFVTKYRHPVLIGDIETFAKERTREICTCYRWELLEIEVMPDHVHLFVSAPPKLAPSVIASTLKSILAVDIFRAFPTLKKRRFWGSGLWTDSTYYGGCRNRIGGNN
jgi:putative transposase